MKPFENKVWLSSPTMHGEEIEYVKEAYETNWMSTVGANINEVERITCEKVGCKYSVALSAGTAALHMAMKLAGEQVYGKDNQCPSCFFLQNSFWAVQAVRCWHHFGLTGFRLKFGLKFYHFG